MDKVGQSRALVASEIIITNIAWPELLQLEGNVGEYGGVNPWDPFCGHSIGAHAA